MSHDRKEPTLSNPSANLSEKRPVSSGPKAKPATRQAAPARPQVIVQKQSSGLLWITLLIALLSALAVVYTYWQLHLSQQIITQQQERIGELQDKLALSDDESTQSLTVLNANVKDLDKSVKLALSEVDKLWATRNVNRKAIGDTKKELEGRIAQVQKSVVVTEEKLNKPLSALQQRSSEQELLVQSLRERLSEQEQELSSLSSQAKKYALTKDMQSLSNKVKGHDEAIESFDKFRVSVNRDLLALKQRPVTTTPTPATSPR